MQHFISLVDHSPAEIGELLELAQKLKSEWREGGNPPLLEDRVMAMVFQKPSLRTRVSFDMAMRQLGGDALYLSPAEIGLGEREAIKDVSRVLSGYVDCVMARVFAHEHVEELAAHATVPVINGLSDFNHPCQALADVFTILERFGELESIRVAYVGDGNNVAVSLLHACAQLGMHYTVATPEGYGLAEEVIERSEGIAKQTGGSVRVTQDPHEAVIEAQVIYTDTWVSMGQEAESARREELFPPFQVNASLVAGGGKRSAGGAIPALPGERQPGDQSRCFRDRDALPARPSRSRDHR
jgi:ornithine carbamoyltransferase